MSIEETIVRRCSPTLAGIKSASIVTIKISSCSDCPAILESLNNLLNKKGIFFAPLRCHTEYILVFIYNRSMLIQSLSNPSIQNFLLELGYPVFDGVGAILSKLTMRFSTSTDFPHEIGIFLGYPLDDVKGFIANKGRNYKISGLWKVYSDESKAKFLFAKYAECTRKCTEQYLRGISIEQICMQSSQQ